MWESEEAFMAEMVDAGCVQDIYQDETGETRIVWNLGLLKEKYPEVHEVIEEAHLEEIKEHLMDMTDRGLLEMSFETQEDGTLEEVFMLSDKGREYVEHYAKHLKN